MVAPPDRWRREKTDESAGTRTGDRIALPNAGRGGVFRRRGQCQKRPTARAVWHNRSYDVGAVESGGKSRPTRAYGKKACSSTDSACSRQVRADQQWARGDPDEHDRARSVSGTRAMPPSRVAHHVFLWSANTTSTVRVPPSSDRTRRAALRSRGRAAPDRQAVRAAEDDAAITRRRSAGGRKNASADGDGPTDADIEKPLNSRLAAMSQRRFPCAPELPGGQGPRGRGGVTQRELAPAWRASRRRCSTPPRPEHVELRDDSRGTNVIGGARTRQEGRLASQRERGVRAAKRRRKIQAKKAYRAQRSEQATGKSGHRAPPARRGQQAPARRARTDYRARRRRHRWRYALERLKTTSPRAAETARGVCLALSCTASRARVR